MMMLKILVVVTVFTVAWLSSSSVVNRNAVVQATRWLPRRSRSSRRNRRGFRWQASLNRETGIASSKEETPRVSKRSPLHDRVVVHGRETSGDDDSDLLRIAQVLVKGYPAWLCSFPITFGLLEAVERKQGAYEIRTRPFGVHLLTFGPVRGQRLTYRQRQQVTREGSFAGKSNNNDDDYDVQTTQCTVTLPITGGLLSLSPPRGGGAAIMFLLKKSTRLPSSEEEKTTKGDDSVIVRKPDSVCSLTSALVGYRPWLAGSKLPVPLYRKCLYLGTQSVIHACVMWRFHRHLIWHASTDAAMMMATKATTKSTNNDKNIGNIGNQKPLSSLSPVVGEDRKNKMFKRDGGGATTEQTV